MRYTEIAEIRNALQVLGNEKLPIAYEVAKNIRKCNRILDEVQDIVKELHGKYADKDEKGTVKQYEEDGKQLAKISDPAQLLAYQQELAKIDTEEHEIEFIKISSSKLDSEKLTGNILVPLIDVVIID